MICRDIDSSLILSETSVNFIAPVNIREYLDQMLSNVQEYKLIFSKGSVTLDIEYGDTIETMFSEEDMDQVVDRYKTVVDKCRELVSWGVPIIDFRLGYQNQQYYTTLSYIVPSGKRFELRYIRDYPTTDIFPIDLIKDLTYIKQKHPLEVFQDKPAISGYQAVAQLRAVLEDLAANKNYGRCKFDSLPDGTFTVIVTLPSGLIMSFNKEAKDIDELNGHIKVITEILHQISEHVTF